LRLLAIANRYYLATLIIVFVAGSLAAYLILKSIINQEFNEKLFAEQDQLLYELRNYENLEKTYYLNIGDLIEINEVAENPNIPPTLIDTVMYDPYEKKELPFRLLTFSSEIKSRFYVITISKSLLPNQDLMEGVSEIMLGIALMLMVSLGLLNRFIFKKLWHPFHQIIDQLHKFQITHPEQLAIEPSHVEEFNDLRQVLDKMISKSIYDYKTLKEYTENTSHEIQTPLAIIKNKAEMLLQEPLSEAQLNEVSKIYEAAGRLSRLKEGLSTLTKIDNNQFVESEPIELKAFIMSRLSGFDELVDLKGLKVDVRFEANPILNFSNDLMYMMVTNLLSNSIKHNIQNGTIRIILTQNHLVIENTGRDPGIPTSSLFDRFKRSGDGHESTGLGLSIIKRIADLYDMTILYTYEDGWHRIIISFNSQKHQNHEDQR